MLPLSRMRHVLDLFARAGRDPSAFSLIVANLITIELALLGRWQLAHVMRVYWWQSVIIGAFHFIRLLRLRHFHMEGPDESGRIVAPTVEEKVLTAVTFVLVYGGMHIVYLRFIRGLAADPPEYPYLLPVAVFAFAVNHLFSFLKNVQEDAGKWRSLPGLVRLAHWRVLPMHAVLMLGIGFRTTQLGAAFFLVLKMIADVLMHEEEHFMRADPAPLRPGRNGRADE